MKSTKSNYLKLFTLTAFFLILTEHITVINSIVALIVSALITTLSDSNVSWRRYIKRNSLLKWMGYGCLLFYEVVKANIQVAMITLSKDMPIAPRVIYYKSKLTDEWLLTILANSITLTPGTMTVDIEGNQLLIHCLNQSYADGISEMLLEKKLCEIERNING